MREWIVFDAMGVIFPVPDDIGDLLLPFLGKKKRGISAERVYEAYYKASLGQIDTNTFWSEIGFGKEYPNIESEYLDTCFAVEPEFPVLAMKMSKRFRIGLLSNDVGEWSRRLRAKFGLEALFSVVVVSGDAGFRKPDYRIFEVFLERASVPAEGCIFVDDRLRNLAPAKALGMRTILFDRLLPDVSGFQSDATVRNYSELSRILETLV
jgi:FMN phosphatase YigB (HAD superfamily)